jgi:hypothetical protein
MKILKYTAVLSTFIVFAFIGCSDKYQTPLNPNTVQSLKKTTGPGAWIIIDNEKHAAAYLDEDSGYLLTLGIKDPTEFCSPTQNYELFNFRDLILPNSDPDLRRTISKITGEDISAFVWHFDSVPANIITFACNNQPIASGNVKFVYTDNNLYVVNGGINRDSFGATANGTLTGTDGKTYKLNLVYNGLVDKNDPTTLFRQIINIHLTLTSKK